MTKTAENTEFTSILSADALLSIPADCPERLFINDRDEVTKRYRRLAMKWHPDHNSDPRAGDVLAHLSILRACAEERLAAGTWQTPGELALTGIDGKKYSLSYVKKAPFEFGDCYISKTLVTYVVGKGYKAHYDNALKTIKGLSFADDKMRTSLERALPRIKSTFATKDGYVLILEKNPEQVRLRDLLDHAGGSIEPRHAAWVLSTMHNLSCYLSLSKLTHNDISLDNYYIGPKAHSGALLGGWWYATKENASLASLPDRTYDAAPPDVLRNGKADPRVDLGLIRLAGREMLGDPKGLSLHKKKEIPKPLAIWLRLPSSGDAIADYKAWQTNTLPESFGARRYAELTTTFSDIYKEGEKTWASPPPPNGPATPAPHPR